MKIRKDTKIKNHTSSPHKNWIISIENTKNLPFFSKTLKSRYNQNQWLPIRGRMSWCDVHWKRILSIYIIWKQNKKCPPLIWMCSYKIQHDLLSLCAPFETNDCVQNQFDAFQILLSKHMYYCYMSTYIKLLCACQTNK